MIQATDVTKYFDQVLAIDHVSAQIQEGAYSA